MGLSDNSRANTLSKERIYVFDNIKFLAILLVVIGHAIDFLARESGNWLEKSLFLTIYSVHMPLFIFISGLFVKPMDKSTKFPKQKVISFILIGIVLRIMISLFRLLLGMKISYAVIDMYDSFAWFMWAMAVFTALLWLFREYNTKMILLLSVLVGCMAGYDKFLGDEFALMRIVVFFPVFVAGYMITPETLVKLFSKTWLKIVSAFIIAGFIALFFLNHDIYPYLRSMFTGRNAFTSLGDYYNYGCIVRLGSYVISGVFGFAVMCLVPNRNLGFISKTGTKTLQIYFWHKFFLTLIERFSVYDRIESVTGGTIATTLYLLIAVAITFICALPLFSFPTKQLLSFGKTK